MSKVPGVDFSSGSIGHALSNGAGMAVGARLGQRDFRVFVMLGDGEMQEGQVWEAALFAAHHRLSNLIAIVDRNGYQLDGRVDDVIGVESLADKWRAFGWDVHEVDGHDLSALTALLPAARGRHARTAGLRDRPHRQGQGRVLYGNRTRLAPGLPGPVRRRCRRRRNPVPRDLNRHAAIPAAHPAALRIAIRAALPESWQYRALNAVTPGLSYLSDALIDLTRRPSVVAGSADLQYSNGLNRYASAFPERYVGMEHGLGRRRHGHHGLMPFVATFASFLGLLCCEQIRMDVAYTRLPVRLIGHHTGISLGFYGTSHHATEDISTTRAIAGLTVVSPADGATGLGHQGQRRLARAHLLPHWPRPRSTGHADGAPFRFGRAITHALGGDLNIIACGIAVHAALQAAERREAGLSVGVIDMPTIKPLDRDAVLAARAAGRMLTVEEHNVMGGLAVAEVLADGGLGVRLRRHGIHDEYSLIAPPTALYAHYRLDADGIAAVARELLEQK